MPKQIPSPHAIIFDLDGVIVDSMPYHFIAWYESLQPFDVRVSCFDVFAQEGERWDKSVTFFLKRAGIQPTASVLRKIFLRRQKVFKKNFKRFIFKDAPELLRCLHKQGFPLALVTGTPYAEVIRILPKNLRSLFSVIISGDCVKKGKPHPEPYLKAAERLDICADHCIVIENAPYGIASAKAAGMFCIAVSTSLPASYLAKADRIVDSLDKIPALLKTCGGTLGAPYGKARGIQKKRKTAQ